MKISCVVFCCLSAIALFGCATAKPPSIFVPHPQADVTYYYRNGMPIVVAKVESSLVCFVVDPSAQLGSTKYIRLWALFQNNSHSNLLLEPLKFFSLTLHDGRDSLETILPESPTKILTSMSNDVATNLILQSIGGTLKALSTQPTAVTSSGGERLQLNDRQEKIDKISEQTNASVTGIAAVYRAYANSASSGILRRNTILPGESVNGYVYFQFPQTHGRNLMREYIDLTKYELRLDILTPIGSKGINLMRLEGE